MAIDDWPAVAVPGGTAASVPETPERATIGQWSTESDSVAALDRVLRIGDLFRVYGEVKGTLVQPRPGQRDKGMRIDRLCTPTAKLLNLGWTFGAIGLEAKRSGEKIGPAIAQAMDYGRSVWELPGGMSAWLEYVFIWPMTRPAGTVESICAQHRIGHAHSTDWHALRLQVGAFNILDIHRNGDVHLGTAYALPSMGKGAGRR